MKSVACLSGHLPLDYHFTDTTQDEVSAVGIKKTSPESKVCSLNLPSAVALSFYPICNFMKNFKTIAITINPNEKLCNHNVVFIALIVAIL